MKQKAQRSQQRRKSSPFADHSSSRRRFYICGTWMVVQQLFVCDQFLSIEILWGEFAQMLVQQSQDWKADTEGL